jgi:signal peptidase I
MSLHDLSIIVLISFLIVLLPSFGLFRMFQKAGIPGWKAFVPFLNTWEIVKAAHLTKHWWFWQFIPIVGWFISIWLLVEWVKLFGKFSFLSHAAAALLSLIYFPYLAFNDKEKFLGYKAVKNHKKSTAREWIDAGVFAVVAATLIRIFIFEAYTIPTGSMEKTLLVNDFLFVSKLSYGPRIPNTPLAIPFVHHTIPGLKIKSYTEVIKLPYTRWFETPIKRNDVVVFNFPAGDTLIKEYDSGRPYYDVLTENEMSERRVLRDRFPNDPARVNELAYQNARNAIWDNSQLTLMTRPVDKRENYIKRCVGLPGDTIEIRSGILYVNNQKAFISSTSATTYNVLTSNKVLSDIELREAGVRISSQDQDYTILNNGQYELNLTLDEVELVKKIPGVTSVTPSVDTNFNYMVFPRDQSVAQWSIDKFGPLWVPRKGIAIELTKQNIAFYKRAIQVYENNEWEERDGKIFLNGKEATSYTFKMNYYWMMGDNRHRSQDSRYWGFVPEDHIVGEAWLIWMSWEGGPRWKRLFKTIH